ncbi:MAG: glycosyltransferase family 9 protein [Candidatus Omnitrophica bacterium]|nr:glycosyltransferase family 9 protein [Candidatus Omnitrophota bacterium]
MNLNKIERILLVRLSALGDCAAAIPVYTALRGAFPKAHIAWLIQDNFSSLIRNLPGLDEIIIFPRQRWRAVSSWRQKIREGLLLQRRLRLKRFDLVVDVQSNTKSSVLGFLTRSPIRIGHGSIEARELSKWLNNVHIPSPPQFKHVIQKNLHLLTSLGIEEREPRFSLPIDNAARRRIQRWLQSHDLPPNDYIVLFPFCGRKPKEWPDRSYAELVEKLALHGRKAVVSVGPGEKEAAGRLISPPARQAVFLGPETELPELIELIRSAGICVGGDTGPLQIAGALNVPNIALFGPTNPERTRPWSNCRVIPLHSDPDQVLSEIEERIS